MSLSLFLSRFLSLSAPSFPRKITWKKGDNFCQLWKNLRLFHEDIRLLFTLIMKGQFHSISRTEIAELLPPLSSAVESWSILGTYSSGTTCHPSAINTGNTGLLNSSFFWSFWKGTQENWVIEFSMNHCGGIIGLEIWKCQVSLNTPLSLSILISQCIRLFWTKVTSIWCLSKKIIFHSAGAFFNGMPAY